MWPRKCYIDMKVNYRYRNRTITSSIQQ